MDNQKITITIQTKSDNNNANKKYYKQKTTITIQTNKKQTIIIQEQINHKQQRKNKNATTGKR